MRFLVDANLPRSLAARIRALGHYVLDVRDTPLARAPDDDIAAFARRERWAILSRDFDFADVRNYPPGDYDGIVVVDLPNEVHSETVISLTEAFIADVNLLAKLPGSLVIVEPGRVRIRKS